MTVELQDEHWTKRFKSIRPLKDDGKDFVDEALVFYYHVLAKADRFKSLGGIPPESSPKMVRLGYDLERQDIWDMIDEWPYERAVYGVGSEEDFVLFNNQIRYGGSRGVMEWLLNKIKTSIEKYITNNDIEGNPLVRDGCVVEVGCGVGRNLFYLKKVFPHITFIGIDISSVSCHVGRELSRQYKLPVEFICCDITADEPNLKQRPDVVFTHHAIEGMTKIFPLAINAIGRMHPKAIVMFEPIVELYGDSDRHKASRMRIKSLDRMIGLLPTLQGERGRLGIYDITVAEPLGYAANPLNETCLLIMEFNATTLKAWEAES